MSELGELFDKQELKEAYLTGKLSDYLDELMIKNKLTIEDVGKIKSTLDEIKEESKTIGDYMVDIFKDELIKTNNTEYLTKEDTVEIARAIRLCDRIKKRIDIYLNKGKDDNGEKIKDVNGNDVVWNLSKDDCADLALSIINNMESLYLYASHWERKFDNDRKMYMEKYHLQRKTAEEFAKCDKNYVEFDKINIKVKVLKEKMLILKKKAGINE